MPNSDVIDSLTENGATTTSRVRIPDTQQGMEINSFLRSGILAPLFVDVTGDGLLDYTIDGETGQITVATTPVPTPVPVKSTKTGTKIKHDNRPPGAVAGLSTTSAVDVSMGSYYEQMFVLLMKLKVLLYEYEKSLQ